jgi:hypothetical protein
MLHGFFSIDMGDFLNLVSEWSACRRRSTKGQAHRPQFKRENSLSLKGGVR